MLAQKAKTHTLAVSAHLMVARAARGRHTYEHDLSSCRDVCQIVTHDETVGVSAGTWWCVGPAITALPTVLQPNPTPRGVLADCLGVVQKQLNQPPLPPDVDAPSPTPNPMIPTGTKADGRAVVNVSSPPASSLAAHAGPPTCCAKCQHMNPRGAQVCAQCAHPIVESKRGSRLGARTRRSLRAMRHQARRAALARRLGGVQGCCRNMCRGPVLFVIIFFTLWYGGLCVGFAFVTDYVVVRRGAGWCVCVCVWATLDSGGTD